MRAKLILILITVPAVLTVIGLFGLGLLLGGITYKLVMTEHEASKDEALAVIGSFVAGLGVQIGLLLWFVS